MAKDRFCRYIWILSQLYNYGELTFDELNQKWLKCTYNTAKSPISKRTFIDHKKNIEELFDVIISCDKKTYKYSIENRKYLDRDYIRRWLLDSFTIGSTLLESQQLNARIAVENSPGHNDYLITIIQAMKSSLSLEIDYKSFNAGQIKHYIVEPYFLKYFKQRWYLVCKLQDNENLYIFAFDRINNIKISSESFVFDKNVGTVTSFFEKSYGVEVNPDDYDYCKVTLKVYNHFHKCDYFRQLPLHHSQKEIESGVGYAIFEYKLYLSYDFKQELLSHASEIEVLSPQWFRDEIKQSLLDSLAHYKEP